MNRNEIIELCRKVISIDSKLDVLYSRQNDEDQYGKFDPALYLVSFYFSDDEIDIIFNSKIIDHKSRETKNKFIQTWNHEYLHLYQSLSMKAVKNFALILKNKLKIDTVILLKYLEREGVYKIEDDRFIQSVVINGAYILDETDANELSIHNSIYKAYNLAWASSKLINPRQIVEGMAHIFSKNMSDDPENSDYFNLESKALYLEAYNYFLQNGGGQIKGIRTRYIIFCYICYFSCQIDINWEQTDTFDVISKLFQRLCSHITHLIDSIEEVDDSDIEGIKAIFKRYLGDKLYNEVAKELDNDVIREIKNILEIISVFRNIVDETCAGLKYKLDLDYPSDFIAIQKKASTIYEYIYDDIALLMMMIFPKLYSKITRQFHRLEKTKFMSGNSKFSIGQEREFYKFIINYKDFINPARDAPWCCAKHDYKNSRKSIIKCESEDSFAQTFQKLLNRSLAECVLLPKLESS